MMRTLLVRASIVVLGACGFDEPVTATSTAPLKSENSLTTNALIQNGLFDNGLFDNGLFDNGLFDNGLFDNGVSRDGLLKNGLWQDLIWQNNPAALEMLRTNPYTRQVLQYIYECAMPVGQSTMLYPGDPPSPSAPAGDSSPVVLAGRIGLAPEWGDANGTCDQSCQRWVSACVLARTNAYGVKVSISMRAPDDAPAHVRAALRVGPDEADYKLREGAFYGNLFQTTPGPNGIAVRAPVLYACAGPLSNIPDLTKRFCSSQGADGPITVVGTCVPREDFPPSACEAVGSLDEPLRRCFADTAHAPGTEYTEVITVYLKEPLAVCGNHVCEATEDASCPSDCHPGGWAWTFPFQSSGLSQPSGADNGYKVGFRQMSAFGPGGTLVMIGASNSTVDLGEVVLDPGPGGDQHGVIVKYGVDSRPMWARRFGPFGSFVELEIGGITVLDDGSILASGNMSRVFDKRAWLAKFSTTGDLLWTVTSSTSESVTTTAPVVDGDGNVFVAGSFYGDITFGATTLASISTDTFVVKFSSAGVPLWVIKIGGTYWDEPTALAVDPNGDVVVGLASGTLATGLWKLCGASGNVLWTRRGKHWGVTTDASGNVYATGSLGKPSLSNDPLGSNTYNFPIPAGSGPGDFFVVKYSGEDGAVHYVRTVPMSCRSRVLETRCHGRFDGRTIVLDNEGNVIVGIHGGNRAPIDFWAGTLHDHLMDQVFVTPFSPGRAFDTYETKDVFAAAFSPDLEVQWVKHMPMILDGIHHGMAIGSSGRIAMGGAYGGSMQIDDRLLVNNIPEQRYNGNTFLATFATPSSDDATPPAMSYMPLPTIAEATSPDGADVFFMPPTAIDAGHAGAAVTCVPAPSTMFPIGTTQVTCTASDPRGNHAATTFPVTVADTTGPAFGGVPAPITIEATGPAGAVVSFATPTAVDLVDGPRPVTCSHASGAVFPIGTTVVQCFASDASGHETQTAFGVTVMLTWSGVLQPISAGGTSSFKLGSAITVKFQLTGASSPITDAVATLSLVRLSPNPAGAVIQATPVGHHNTGNTFRYDASTGQYIYNLSTKPLSAGTWSLRINPGDGVIRTVTISLHE